MWVLNKASIVFGMLVQAPKNRQDRYKYIFIFSPEILEIFNYIQIIGRLNYRTYN